jgi:hypothetical protein
MAASKIWASVFQGLNKQLLEQMLSGSPHCKKMEEIPTYVSMTEINLPRLGVGFCT